MKKIILLIAILLLTACATTANYQQIVNQWQGAKAQDLINTWGYPDAAVKLPNGNTVYTYTRQQLYNMPVAGPTTPIFNSAGMPVLNPGFNNAFGSTQIVNFYCRTWFEANPKGIVVNVSFHGNNCIASK